MRTVSVQIIMSNKNCHRKNGECVVFKHLRNATEEIIWFQGSRRNVGVPCFKKIKTYTHIPITEI